MLKKMDGNRKGYILMTSYLMISVLSIFSIALFSRENVFLQATERNKNKIIAFQMAEAGLDSTIVQLNSDANYSGAASYSALGTNGGYVTTVCPPSCAGLTPAADPLIRLVQTTGYAPGNDTAARAYEARQVLSYLKLDSTPFEYAAFAENSLILNGVPLVDSYNSANGDYGGANVLNHGDIASDGTISLIGNPTVNGSIVQSPEIECGPAAATAASTGPLSLGGNTNYTLAAGTYHFDSITITGNAKITATGPVTVYVDGAVSLGGNGLATHENKPSNFLLFATGSGSISISGNGGLYAGIYAPGSSINNSGNATIYGSVIARDYQQNGTADLHFDEALKNISAPYNAVDMLSWRETNTAAS